MTPRPRTVKPPTPTFFATAEHFRGWLEAHHDTESEFWVGFYKKGSGKPSITWPESVDEALCVGWIDGVRKTLDDERYMIRFTPRQVKSTWSSVNVKRVAELTAQGRMRQAGLDAFARRQDARTGTYSYEQRRNATLAANEERAFRANKKAWAFFEAQAPWYRRTSVHWVTTAKRPETRARRLATLIADSAKEQRIAPLTPARTNGRRK